MAGRGRVAVAVAVIAAAAAVTWQLQPYYTLSVQWRWRRQPAVRWCDGGGVWVADAGPTAAQDGSGLLLVMDRLWLAVQVALDGSVAAPCAGVYVSAMLTLLFCASLCLCHFISGFLSFCLCFCLRPCLLVWPICRCVSVCVCVVLCC